MKIIYNAQSTVLDGARTLYNAVSSTLGPKGRNVLIKTQDGITVTHDGVTVANAVTPDNDDKYGVELIKQASNKMNDKIGDGTTTVSVLTYHLIHGLYDMVQDGSNAMVAKKEIERLSPIIIKDIERSVTQVDKNKLEQVAIVSAADEEIGKLVSDVVWKVGTDGTVITELSGTKTESEIINGMKLNYGFASPYFASNGKDSRLDKTNVLVFDGRITSIHDLLPIMGQLAEKNLEKLVIFCESAGAEVLANLVLNLQRGTFTALVVEIPSHATIKLADIAARVGANMITKKSGRTLKEVVIDDLGFARTIVSNNSDTSIIEGAGKIEKYIETLDKKNDIDKRRIAAIEGKVAVIRVGGLSETEIDEKKYRIDDAILASQSALRGGIVPGGGTVLYNIGKRFDGDGISKVIRDALQAPYKTLLDNAAIDFADIKKNECINVFTEKKVNAINNGIVDPADVTKSAVETALSVAAIAISSGVIIDSGASDDKKA